MARTESASKTLLIIISVIGWFALIVQFYLIIQNRNASIPETIIRYFGFFTILTNIFVAVGCTVLAIKKPAGLFRFFSKSGTQTALLIYITVVGLVYNIILRVLWDPQGMDKVVDELLHTVIPILYIIYWLTWTDKKPLHWSNIPAWLIYPAAYAIFILIRGAFVHYYPYPFMNVNELGYGQVLINSGVLVLVFLFFSITPVAIGKYLHGHSRPSSLLILIVPVGLLSCIASPSVDNHKIFIVKSLPGEGFKLDGKLDEKQWQSAGVIKNFMSPWVAGAKDYTIFRAFHDQQFFYFSYVVKDSTMTVYKYVNEETVLPEDRVELFLSQTAEMKKYFGFEMDPQAEMLDYTATAGGKFDFGWRSPDLVTKTQQHQYGYELEGRVPLSFIRKIAIENSPDLSVYAGVFRADYYGKNMDAVTWFSWLKPASVKPNFHIPSSFGIFKFEKELK